MMTLSSLARAPWRHLRSQPVRYVISMLSIIVCVALGIILSGFTYSIENVYSPRFETLARTFQFSEFAPISPRATGMQDLSDADVAALRTNLDPALVAHVIPMFDGTGVFSYQDKKFRSTVTGSTPDYLEYKSTRLLAGRMFNDEEYNSGSRVVLIAPGILQDFFGGNSSTAIGSAITIGRVSFRIVGIIGPDATGSPNTAVLIPLTAARDDLYGGGQTVSQIGFITTDASVTSRAAELATQILSDRHTPKKGYREQDFTTSLYQAPSQAVAPELLKGIFWLSAWAALVALIFGITQLSAMLSKIVIANSRTIEMFLEMRVRRSAIYWRVIAESTFTAALSGALGVVLGVGLLEWAQRALPQIAPQFGIPEISTPAVAGVFGFSLVAGILAGLVPAKQAAKIRSRPSTVSYGCCPAIGALRQDARHNAFVARPRHPLLAPAAALDRNSPRLELIPEQKVRTR